MIKIERFVFNPFQENTFILYDESKDCVIIDPGCYEEDEKEQLARFIKENGLLPVYLLNTHCHVDHILGNTFVKQQYHIPFLSHKEDEFLIHGMVDHGETFGLHAEQSPLPDEHLQEGDTVAFGNSTLQVYHVPGHSPGSIVFYSPNDRFVIAGDVLFMGSIGRTDLPGGDYNTLINGIKQKLFPLGDEVNVYPGHGPSTTIQYEKENNPFLVD